LRRTTEGTHKRSKQADKVLEQNQALAAELELRGREAAIAQSKGMAGVLAQLEAGPFDLPNPGGGENLVEAARMQLVAGGTVRVCRQKFTLEDDWIPRMFA
jgi:ATP-binding cassette subfamily F protein 3